MPCMNEKNPPEDVTRESLWRLRPEEEAALIDELGKRPVTIEVPIDLLDNGGNLALRELGLSKKPPGWAHDMLKLASRISALENAIRAHRDMKYDDRCLEDDKTLYAVLNEPIPDFALPPAEDMLESCRRYIESRGCPVSELPPGKMTIRQLEDEVARLRDLLSEPEEIVAKLTKDGGIFVDVQHWAVKLLVGSLAESLGTAPNFTTAVIGPVPHADGGMFEVTIQRCEGKSPAQHIAEITAERDEYASAALAGLLGLVPTPEKGYVADGGVAQLKADFRALRSKLNPGVAREAIKVIADQPMVKGCLLEFRGEDQYNVDHVGPANQFPNAIGILCRNIAKGGWLSYDREGNTPDIMTRGSFTVPEGLTAFPFAAPAKEQS